MPLSNPPFCTGAKEGFCLTEKDVSHILFYSSDPHRVQRQAIVSHNCDISGNGITSGTSESLSLCC